MFELASKNVLLIIMSTITFILLLLFLDDNISSKLDKSNFDSQASELDTGYARSACTYYLRSEYLPEGGNYPVKHISAFYYSTKRIWCEIEYQKITTGGYDRPITEDRTARFYIEEVVVRELVRVNKEQYECAGKSFEGMRGPENINDQATLLMLCGIQDKVGNFEGQRHIEKYN